MKVVDILHSSAVKFNNTPVIIDSEGSLTFAELNNQVSLARDVLIKNGVKPGMNLALCLKDSRDFIIYLFAASACGATVVPLGFYLNNIQYQELISDLDIDALLHYTDKSYSFLKITGSKLFSEALTLSFFSTKADNNKKYFTDTAFIRPTSGTTGRAKGVVFSHQAILQRIDNALEGMSIGNNDRVLWVLPMAYHFIVSILLYVRAGTAVIIPKDKSAKELIQMANAHNATILYAGPGDFTELAEFKSTEKLPLMKLCICTVGGVTESLIHKFNKRHNNILRQVYGMIEIGLPLGNITPDLSPDSSVGKSMKGFEVKILKQNGEAARAGQIGELLIKGLGLFDGYYNPYIPRESISKNGWFQTGDAAYFDEMGNYYICGRKASLLDINDRVFFAEEIEGVLNDHPGVKISRVYKLPKGDSGLIADVELKKGKLLSDIEIINYCSRKLESAKVPMKVNLIENLPLTATGKVFRYEV